MTCSTKKSRLLLLLRTTLLLLLQWCSIRSPLIGSLSTWHRKYRSFGCITVPRSLPNRCLLLRHSMQYLLLQYSVRCLSCLPRRSPPLTPIVQLFFGNKILLYCIVQSPRHKNHHLSTNVEVETKHKLVNL
jgi:hypothetical protein